MSDYGLFLEAREELKAERALVSRVIRERDDLRDRLAEVEAENEQLRLAVQFFRENAGLADTA